MHNPGFDCTDFVEKMFEGINSLETEKDLDVCQYLIDCKRQALNDNKKITLEEVINS